MFVRNYINRSPWLIIYLPVGSQPTELYQKIYSKICSEFHFERAGDRSSMLLLQSFRNMTASASAQPSHFNAPLPQNIFNDVLAKLRESVISSLQQRRVQH